MSAAAMETVAIGREVADALFLPVDRDWSGDSVAAVELAGILAVRGWDVSVSAVAEVGGSVRWRAGAVHMIDFATGVAEADTMPLALCLAVLKAHDGWLASEGEDAA